MLHKIILSVIYINTLINKLYLYIPIIFIIYYYEKIVVSDILNHLFTYFIGGSIFSQYFLKDVIYNICKGSYNYIKNVERYVIYDGYKNTFNKYILCEEYKSRINELMIRYILCDGYGYVFSDKDNEHISEHLDMMIELINTEKISHTEISHTEKISHTENLHIPELVKNLEKFISDYPEVKDSLNYEIINPALLTLIKANDKFNLPISPILLSGKPGTGKTRFAKKLAEILDAKIVEYHDDSVNHRNSEYINFRENLDSQVRNFNSVTKLILAKNRYKILLIDEMGEKLKTDNELIKVLLKMLSSVNDRSIRDNFLDLDIKIPNNIIIICTSNNTLDDLCAIDNKFNSLKSRFVEIKIPNVQKSIQLKIVTEYITSIYPNIDDSDRKFIENIINMSNYDGLRELLNISTTYVQFLHSIESLKSYKIFSSKENYQETLIKKIKLTTV